MNLDIRLPMGIMFTVFGLILAGWGWMTRGDAMYQHALGWNINLAWGVVLLVIGATMTLFAIRTSKRST